MAVSNSTSVIIVSYKTGPVLFDCLSACLNFPEKPEIIVVDNGNPLSDQDKLRRWAATNDQIKLLEGHGNIGFSAAVNKGVANATGDYIWILNPDAVPAPDTLTRHYATLPNCKTPFIVGAAICHSDGSEQRGGRRQILTPRTAFIEALKLYRFAHIHSFFERYNHHEDDAITSLVEMPVVSGASMFMRRRDFITLNGFDENYFMHVEDMDLCLRIGRMGGTVYYAGNIPLTHIGGTSDKSKIFIEHHKAKGFVYYFRKNFHDQYSPILLSLVSAGIYARFLLIAAKIGWSNLWDRGEKARPMEYQTALQKLEMTKEIAPVANSAKTTATVEKSSIKQP